METKMTVQALIEKWGTRSIGAAVRDYVTICRNRALRANEDPMDQKVELLLEMMGDLDAALTHFRRMYPED